MRVAIPRLAAAVRALILFVLVGRVSASAGSSSGAGPSRPNILLLFADDQRADTIAAWGNPHIRTPNLDRLVRRGTSFRGNYCFGSNSGAVCVPSRAMLMSGRTWLDVPHDLHGVTLLPEVLREAGYETFATGKWHNGEASFVRAFPDGRSVFFGGMADHTKVPVADVRDGQVVNRRIAEKFSSEQFADAAIDFLRSRSGDGPFFCYVAFTAPHDPRNPPEPYREMYYRDRPPLPANFLPAAPVRQRHDQGHPRREPRPLPADPGGHRRPALRVLRPHHPPRRAGRADPGGAGGVGPREGHGHHLHGRPRPGAGQPRAARQAEPLRAQHEAAR